MLFNSFSFLLFLPIVFALYWWVNKKSLGLQNVLLLMASYFFYACWDWRFLFLLVFSTALDYFTGIKMAEAKNLNHKKKWFWLSIIVNLGFLGIFKYYNFFADSFAEALSVMGIHSNFWTLKVILPVGISFYTFHGLSYVIDIYKGRIEPERNIITYSLFVGYFPLLVAGPIERATHLLPQIKKRRFFDYNIAMDGVHQIIWGLFKKVVIADNCALYANDIFDHYESMNSLSLLLGAVYFSFQIYGDFSGYSDIALGTSKLFGIDLLRNFNYPYFSRDIAEFWRRWHISLSSWFRDYLYIPLGGSRGGTWMKVRNTFIVFLVSGFWHGANWTFIVWGSLHAVFFLPLLITQNNRNNLDTVAKGKNLPTIKEFLSMLLTFSLTTFAWIFFRAKTVAEACSYIKMMFSFDFRGVIQYLDFERYSVELLLLLGLFVVFEWKSREKEHPIAGKFAVLKALAILMAILIFGAYSNPSDFIYFQF
ncbi:D-alanyl-lipoteichoic acid acyltransferase DltB, MBOAT superfamily [Flavobacterium fluvii]|uniref:D-alanyl-lipoteichoic acid acyltransferase DltB, MBOAT superfamily n=1 Tax=Flavobacterium fluvii TaxID=468056 RepID=A0A1M5IQZ7_9FLAO|nr:MBOAT family O-acyltransferase [Flavobacterium fluvii]SHG30758.1 D-alanyl-lipoteichoic acid acyltransferase DltB, MBOAT superfamily [Flavobacterium fluvii]